MKVNKLSTKLCYILQFYFVKGTNPVQTHEEIYAGYGQDTLSKATAMLLLTAMLQSLLFWKF